MLATYENPNGLSSKSLLRAKHEAFEAEYTFYTTLKLHRIGHDYDADVYVAHIAEDSLNETLEYFGDVCTKEELARSMFSFTEEDEFELGKLVLGLSSIRCLDDELLEKYGHRLSEDV